MKNNNALEGVDLQKLYDFVKEDGGSGHLIWRPSKFTTMGFKADDLPVEHLESGTGKYAITNTETGEIGDLTGIWNLRFMFWLAGHMNVKNYGSFMGRGFQAQAIQAALLPVLQKMKDEAQ